MSNYINLRPPSDLSLDIISNFGSEIASRRLLHVTKNSVALTLSNVKIVLLSGAPQPVDIIADGVNGVFENRLIIFWNIVKERLLMEVENKTRNLKPLDQQQLTNPQIQAAHR